MSASMTDSKASTMTSEASGHRDTFPSFEECQRPPYSFLPSHRHTVGRLAWRLQDPLETALSVLDENCDPDEPCEPYCQRGADGQLIWHPLAYESLTRPKISSVTVVVGVLDRWEDEWLEALAEADLEVGDEGTVWARPDDPEDYDDEESGLKLMGCNGEERPPRHVPLVVAAPVGSYLTVHDYVTAVHPWLMGLDDEIRKAYRYMTDDTSVDESTPLMVRYLDHLIVSREAEWALWLRNSLASLRRGDFVPIDTPDWD